MALARFIQGGGGGPRLINSRNHNGLWFSGQRFVIYSRLKSNYFKIRFALDYGTPSDTFKPGPCPAAQAEQLAQLNASCGTLHGPGKSQ